MRARKAAAEMGIDGFFASMADARLEGRIDALERENAAIKAYLRATFMPAGIEPDAHMQYLKARIAGAETGREAREWQAQLAAHRQKIAQARWEALFGVPVDGGGEGGAA